VRKSALDEQRSYRSEPRAERNPAMVSQVRFETFAEKTGDTLNDHEHRLTVLETRHDV